MKPRLSSVRVYLRSITTICFRSSVSRATTALPGRRPTQPASSRGWLRPDLPNPLAAKEAKRKDALGPWIAGTGIFDLDGDSGCGSISVCRRHFLIAIAARQRLPHASKHRIADNAQAVLVEHAEIVLAKKRIEEPRLAALLHSVLTQNNRWDATKPVQFRTPPIARDNRNDSDPAGVEAAGPDFPDLVYLRGRHGRRQHKSAPPPARAMDRT